MKYGIVFSKKYLISDIISQINKSGKNLLEEVNLIDVFKEDNLNDDLVYYTFRLSYRDSEKTLLESDISATHANIISTIEEKFHTKLRK